MLTGDKNNINSYPKPNDSKVVIKTINNYDNDKDNNNNNDNDSDTYYAVIKFSGLPTSSEVEYNKSLLFQSLKDNDISTGCDNDKQSSLILARYNEPYVPSVLRRNELLIQVPYDAVKMNY